jgi:hypothetical protein
MELKRPQNILLGVYYAYLLVVNINNVAFHSFNSRYGNATFSLLRNRYLLEQSLSVDNLFVFILVFKYFKVPKEYQVWHNSYSDN